MDNGASSYRRFLEGDSSGIDEIVDSYYDGLVLFLRTLLHDMNDAEDLAEETLYVLLSKKPDYKGKSSFKTWLYSIGRNLAYSHLKRQERITNVEPIDIIMMSVKESQDAEKRFFFEEQRRQLYYGLLDLRPDYRQVLWLKYFENMKSREIASVMRKTEYGVNHLLRKAKECLRIKLEEEGFHYEMS